MKTIKLLAVALGIAVLSGCALGHLKARVVTNRDLTVAERNSYDGVDAEGAARFVLLFPLAAWGRVAADSPAGRLFAMRFLSVPFPPLVGVFNARGALFDREGKRKQHFGLSGFSPLYLHTFCRVKGEDDAWTSQLSYTDILFFFGYGTVKSKTVVRFFFCFGAKRKEIEAANPMFAFFDEDD